MRLLFLLLFSLNANAGFNQFCWGHPTEYENNAPLNVDDIQAYELYYSGTNNLYKTLNYWGEINGKGYMFMYSANNTPFCIQIKTLMKATSYNKDYRRSNPSKEICFDGGYSLKNPAILCSS